MRNLFTKWLSALLIAALLLTPVALMEEAPADEIVDEAPVIVEEASDAAEAVAKPEEEEPAEAAAEEPEEEAVDTELLPEAVEDTVEELGEVSLDLGGEVDLVIEADEAACEGESVGAKLEVNATNFPDDAFRQYLSYQVSYMGLESADKDENGNVVAFDPSELTLVDLTQPGDTEEERVGIGVTDLTGIEKLTGLISLNITGNTLAPEHTKLDLSNNTLLQSIDACNCGLEELVLPENSDILTLDVRGNNFTSFDVTNCPKIAVSVSQNGDLRNVGSYHDISEDYKIISFEVDPTIPLIIGDTTLPASLMDAKSLFKDEGLRQMMLDQCDENNDGYLSDTELSYLDFYGLYLYKVKKVVTESGQITGYEPITDESGNRIPYVVSDWSGIENISITNLHCDNLNLSELDLSKFPYLTSLDCSHNALTKLDLSAKLSTLICNHNNLSALDLSKAPNLSILNCAYNKLSGLDLSNSAQLRSLFCDHNNLTALDFSNVPSLNNIFIDSPINTFIKNVEDGVITHIYYYEYGLGSDGEVVSFKTPRLSYDENVKITVKEIEEETEEAEEETPAAPAAPAAPATVAEPAPAPEPAPVIPAISKSSKTTLSAAPGTVAQLELGGVPGKKFKSSNKKVATVNSAGVVTIKKAGKTKITFKVGKKTRKVTLTIKDPTIPSFIALNLAGAQPAQVGVPQALTVTLPENTTSGIKWKSSNKKVATVSSTGIVTFKKAGKVTITATATRGKKKAKVKFAVSR